MVYYALEMLQVIKFQLKIEDDVQFERWTNEKHYWSLKVMTYWEKNNILIL